MPDQPESRPWLELEQIVQDGDVGRIEEYIEALSPTDAARALARLSGEGQTKVLTTISPESAASLIEEIPRAQAADLVSRVHPPEAAAIISEMDLHEQGGIISALSKVPAEAVLAEMDPADAAEARRVASYAPDTAGSLMVTTYLSFPETVTTGEVIADLQSRAEEYARYDIQYAYVLADTGALLGVLRLRDLLLAPGNRAIGSVMIRYPLAVGDEATLDDLAEYFARHRFIGAPVVSEDGSLVGVVRRNAVEAALAGRSDSDFLKSQGIVGGEELRSMPTYRRSTRRLSWLSVNILLNVLAAGVIAMYQDTVAAVIALAVFLPIISDMSGCSGNQAVAVSIRELSLGLTHPRDLLYVWIKELKVGLINGSVLGLILGSVAWIWQGNPWLGLVAGGALALNTLVAVSIGGIIPLILKRLNRDPALASGPILTTVTDMCGFLMVLSFATALLSRLT